MATRLYLVTPNLYDLSYIDVPENDLIYDGFDFVVPTKAAFVYLLDGIVPGTTLPFNVPITTILTESSLTVRVISSNYTLDPEYSPGAVLVADPTDGTCVCGITCRGTRLSYVQVTLPI